MIKIGVFGAGHLGKTHLKLAEASKELDLIGFYDPNPETVNSIDSSKKYKAFKSSEALIDTVDIVDPIISTSNRLILPSNLSN